MRLGDCRTALRSRMAATQLVLSRINSLATGNQTSSDFDSFCIVIRHIV